MDNPALAPWHSLGVTDQLPATLAFLQRGGQAGLPRCRQQSTQSCTNALGAGKDFGNHSGGLTYNGSAKADENGDRWVATIIEDTF